jgi:hypothetical protein
LGCDFSNNRGDSSSVWIRRNRRGIGGNCEVLVLSVPSDVRNLFLLRLERKRSSVISKLAEVGEWTGERNAIQQYHELFSRRALNPIPNPKWLAASKTNETWNSPASVTATL